MIKFRSSNVHADRPHLTHPGDVFVGVTGRLEIDADGRSVYVEEEFPVVELAADLWRWIAVGLEAGRDFEFDSMSTPEPGWVWIRRTDSGWRVGSLHQERPDLVVRSGAEVRAAVESFIDSVKAAAIENLETDVTQIIEQRSLGN